MVKQSNLFTGKIDILCTSDEKKAAELERYKLGVQAGRVIIENRPQVRKEQDRQQVSLF